MPSTPQPSPYAILEQKLAYTFRDASFCEAALTHKSWMNESQETERTDNERLEFLGDAVLALVTSWSTFQTLVYDVAAKTPIEIARLISATGADGLSREADPVGRLQVTYDQFSIEAGRFDKAAGPATAANAGREAAAARALAGASGAVLMANAGLIAVGAIAVNVLTAIGPMFIALFLFLQTRGLFVGWLRALFAAAMASLSAWVLTILMLNVVEPWLVALAQQRQDNVLDPQTAITAASIVFVFAAGQVVMVLAGVIVALGLRLPGARQLGAASETASPRAAERALAPAEQVSRAARLAEHLQHTDPRDQRAVRAAAAISSGASAARDRRSGPFSAPERIGDLYRRPVVRERLEART
jgi:type IV secretion system protein VirB6